MGQHLSYSQISMYLDCSRKWQGHYKQGFTNPLGEALVFGTVAHNTMEQFVQDKKANLVELWDTAWEAERDKTAFKGIVWEETPDTVYNIGINLFSSNEVYDVLSGIEPMIIENEPAIERFIEWTLEGMPPIIGYIDCMSNDGVPIDFKTAGRMWPADKAGKELQPLFYLAALDQLGEHSHGYKFRHVVVTKTKNPRIEIFENQRSKEEIEFLEMIVRRVWSGISAGVFIPNPTSFMCSPKYCGTWFECVGKYQG